MPLIEPLFLFVALPAVMLTAMSKGGFAGALGGLAVPLMALAISPVQAAAIMLPLLCFMDLVGLRVYWRKWDVANIRIMIPGAIVGIAFGGLTFGTFSDDGVRIIVGIIAVAFAVNSWFNFAARQAAAGRSVAKGSLWSAVAGFTSFVAHAGGPPVMVYLVPQRLDKVTFVATVNLFFLVANAVKLVPYAWLGQFNTENLSTSLLLAPLVPFGVWLGVWLQGRVNETWFYRITQIGMLVSGVQLIYQGL